MGIEPHSPASSRPRIGNGQYHRSLSPPDDTLGPSDEYNSGSPLNNVFEDDFRRKLDDLKDATQAPDTNHSPEGKAAQAPDSGDPPDADR